MDDMDGAIPDALIVAGVAKEVRRTLPFWKACVELREEFSRKPTVVSCEVFIESRTPCRNFPGVDVVWARSDVVLVTWRHARITAIKTKSKVKGKGKVKQQRPPAEYMEVQLSFGSLHFVHRDAHRVGDDKSYNIQSVVLLQRPEQMQCVAGNMVHFAFIVYGMLRLARLRDTVPTATGEALETSAIIPPQDSIVLILGMGGNSMELGIRHVLGQRARVYIAEIEEAVVHMCRKIGLLNDHLENTSVYQCSADEALLQCPNGCTFIFMDIFEPTSGKMINSMQNIRLAYDKLAFDGVLVINEHCLPSVSYLLPLMELFGDHNVQFINVRGWNESVVAATKSSNRINGSSCTKTLAFNVLEIYEELYPGWMPKQLWIQDSRVVYKEKGTTKLRARKWTS